MENVELLSVRNSFYVGDFQKVLAEAKAVDNVDNKTAALRDAFVNRAYIAMGQYENAFRNIGKNAPMGLQAVKLLGTYMSADDDNKEMVFETLKEWLEDEALSSDPTVVLMAAQIHFESGNYKEALRLVHNGDSLEMCAMSLQIYLQINRHDLANKVLQSMIQIDDDDVLTTLATAWVSLAKGGADNTNTAYEHLNELVLKFGETVPLLNSMGVCQIQLGNYAEAFQHLKNARDMAIKNQTTVSAEVLINSMMCLHHLRKPDKIIQHIHGELKKFHPNHPWLKQQEELEKELEAAASRYSL